MEAQKLPDLKAADRKVAFIIRSTWQAKNDELAQSFDQLIDSIEKDADDIKAERKRNGIEGKY
jgi:hypothetical protein